MSFHFPTARRLAALATAVHSVASAIQSIRSPGSEGHNQATHAIDILTQLQGELAGELGSTDPSTPVQNLQADPSTAVTANPGTRESEVLATDPAPSGPADNNPTPASVEANAAAQGVVVEPVKGAEADKAPATPTSKPKDPTQNATGAVGVRSSGSGA